MWSDEAAGGLKIFLKNATSSFSFWKSREAVSAFFTRIFTIVTLPRRPPEVPVTAPLECHKAVTGKPRGRRGNTGRPSLLFLHGSAAVIHT